MKKVIFLIVSLFFLSSIYVINYYKKQVKLITLTSEVTELKKKYPIKSHHEEISLSCRHCHEGQGEQKQDFTYVKDEKCYSCHGNKRKIANRTSYMNILRANPHDSIHNSLNKRLSCNDCHRTHEPSENQCLNCHSGRVYKWMKEDIK